MLLPRCRNLFILKNTFLPSLSLSNSHSASIHSTPPASQKWNHKSKADKRGCQQPSKNNARFVVRQRRADAKRALKGIIFGSLSSRASFEDEKPKWGYDPEPLDGIYKRKQPRRSTRHHAKSHNTKMKRKFRRVSSSGEEDDPEAMFQARFGNQWYTWSFNHSYFRSSNFGHESKWRSRIEEEWDARSESELYDESCSIGSRHDRTILGLPSSGPLNIKDVKNAFRISALKWHPDKHQGPSQDKAEEKFKLCVNAYKSLCDALSGV